MAREFAQIKLAIWADDDWRDLSPLARYLYMTLLTSPSLTHCGVADWRPTRIGALNGMEPDEIEHYGAELIEALFLVIDQDTEEVLIRSFIRNDGLMKQPKMAVAMATAHAGVASKDIRAVIVHEAKRLKADFPDLHGWGSEKATDLPRKRSVDPSTYPLGKGSIKGKQTPIGKGSPTPTPATTPSTMHLTPSQTDVSDPEFDAFWDAYGKKVGKGAAEKAYAKARVFVHADVLLNAAIKHLDWQKRSGNGDRFIPNASTWLNEKRWMDERPEPTSQSAKLSTTDQRIRDNLAAVERMREHEQAQQTQPRAIGE